MSIIKNFYYQALDATSPVQNGLRRTPPKENGDHSKKEPTSPRSGRSSASSTPVPSKKAAPTEAPSSDSSSDKGSKPTTNGSAAGASPPHVPAPTSKPLGGIPGFPGVPGFPGSFPGAENGYRPPLESHPALRLPLGIGPGGKA